MLRKSMERHTVWRDAILGVRDSNVRERPVPAQRTAGPEFDLIASKLRPPLARSGTIRRSSLIERLTREPPLRIARLRAEGRVLEIGGGGL